jgi:hypothetical protein
VTALGWFCCVAGGVSVATGLVQLGNVGDLLARPEMHKAVIESMGGSRLHPITRFQLEHLGLMAGLQLGAALLTLGVGIGLVRREPWAMPLGALLVAMGAVRQASSLLVVLTAPPIQPPGVSAEQARSTVPYLIGLYCLSLAWMGFLVWKFRRPAIRGEFQA